MLDAHAEMLVLFLALLSSAQGLEVVAKYPEMKAGSFFLRGDSCDLNWETGVAMAQVDNSTWTATIDCPSPSTTVEMKVLVNDNDWMLGANHHADPAKESTTTVFPWFYTYQGTLQIVPNVFSNELNNSRDVIYYLPPSYLENTLKVHQNVLVMHDGQNLFLEATAYLGNAWYCQDSLDGTIVGGTTQEVIIAGAYNTADRIDEYTYIYDPSEGGGGNGDLYLDWIESTLLPLTASRFRVNITRDSLGILGSSLGGLISCYAGWTRPSVYGKVGCMSSSFWWDANDFQNRIVPESMPPAPVPDFYMDSGTGSVGEKECTAYTLNIYDQMVQDGFVENTQVFRFVDEGATHSESYWGPRFHIPMEELYPASLA
jgi:predicted alpha/beta superfamily hydrolase